jgi:hypothetical protein
LYQLLDPHKGEIMTAVSTPIRSERRVKKDRPAYLDPELLARVAENAEARLMARTAKRNG